jgi:hypothetical protein
MSDPCFEKLSEATFDSPELLEKHLSLPKVPEVVQASPARRKLFNWINLRCFWSALSLSSL